MTPKFIYDTWFVPPGSRAWVLYPFVFFKYPKSQIRIDTFRHELEHVYQVRRLGWIRFYATYLWYQIRHGYKKNPFEIEANERRYDDLDPIELKWWLES